MSRIAVKDDIFWVGAKDPDRAVFDGLMPLPQGTTYNAYLVIGSEKTALIDTVEPEFLDQLLGNLEGVDKIDYIVSHHAEQDHSGSIPLMLEKYPESALLCLQKNKEMLQTLMTIPENRIRVIEDGGEVSLGNKTIRFEHFPWVHWPETTITYIPEDNRLATKPSALSTSLGFTGRKRPSPTSRKTKCSFLATSLARITAGSTFSPATIRSSIKVPANTMCKS